MKIFFYALLCIAFCLIHPRLSSQDRPKIGLVLSGGGARGIAHIGILKALEEAGIRPDYITGTSMGGIMGGLYACGYTADELEKLVKETDWSEILTNKIEFSQVMMEEKPYSDRYMVEFPVDGFFNVKLPQGLIEGQELSMLLSRLTAHVQNIKDFNDLPIPFKCIGADIANGEFVELDHGSLPLAMRTTMAIPSAFTPIMIDDRLLVDGGLFRNYPVDQAIDMGADIVIGVFVSHDLSTKEELESMVDVLTQASWVMSTMDTRDQTERVNIHITPELSGYNTASFFNADSIYQRGYDAGQAFLPQFQALVEQYHIEKQAPLSIEKLDSITIDTIEVHGAHAIPAHIVVERMKIQTGDKISIDEIEKRIRYLFGTKYYDNIRYEFSIENGLQFMHLYMQEAESGSLKTALHYDTENGVGLLVNFTKRNLFLPFSRAILEIDIAENFKADLNYLKYIGKGKKYATMIGAKHELNDIPSFYEGNQDNVLLANTTELYLDFMTTAHAHNIAGVRGGYMWGHMRAKINAGIYPAINNLQSESPFGEVYYRHDSRNQRYFTTNGFKAGLKGLYKSNISGSAELLLQDYETGLIESLNIDLPSADYWDISGYIAKYKSITPSFTVSGGLNVVLTSLNLNDNVNASDYHYIGGFNPSLRNSHSFLGLNQEEYYSVGHAGAYIDLQFEFKKNFYFNVRSNYIDTEYPYVYFFPENEPIDLGNYYRRLGFGSAVSYNGVLGPITIGAAMDQYRQVVEWYFHLGFYLDK